MSICERDADGEKNNRPALPKGCPLIIVNKFRLPVIRRCSIVIRSRFATRAMKADGYSYIYRQEPS